MKQRDKAFKNARRLNTPETWNLAHLFRSWVAKELRIARKNYITKQLNLANGDGRKFWRIINSTFFPKSAAPVSQIYKSKTDDLPLYDHLTTPQVTCNSTTELSIRRVTEQINAIDHNKFSGFRNIPARLLKLALQAIPTHFTNLLNLCLSQSVFPQSWKKALVVCIPKSGDCRRLNNLRPILFCI